MGYPAIARAITRPHRNACHRSRGWVMLEGIVALMRLSWRERMNSKLLVASVLLAIAGSSAALAQPQAGQHTSAATSFGFYCEAFGPNSGGYCGVNIEGPVATPLNHVWGTTGVVIRPNPCGPSSPICNWSCVPREAGAMTLSVYDANGLLLGSGTRSVCSRNSYPYPR